MAASLFDASLFCECVVPLPGQGPDFPVIEIRGQDGVFDEFGHWESVFAGLFLDFVAVNA